MPKICETAGTVAPSEPGKIKVGLITPGWGSSGYYSPQVLENAATDKVWPKGTHVFFDHPSESEMFDRPERSVRDLAAIFTEDAYWDGEQLVAEANVIGPYRELVTDPVFVEAVGMSIRADAESTVGEAEGRKGKIMVRLEEGTSVDLVTRAGRGGKVLAVLESARQSLREATSEDVRDALQTAVRDAHPGERVYSWVRDFDQDKGLVYFSVEDPEGTGLYQQTYTVSDDGTATLSGDRVEVNVRTEYVPVAPTSDATESGAPTVPAPAGQPQPTPNVQEDTMGTIQVDEAQHVSLTEAAGRVPTLESERDTAQRERDEAREALAQRDRNDAAAVIIQTKATEAGVSFTALECRGLLAHLPIKEGALDKDAFTESVTTALAEKAESNGSGKLHGFNSDTKTVAESADPWAEIDTHLNLTKEG